MKSALLCSLFDLAVTPRSCRGEEQALALAEAGFEGNPSVVIAVMETGAGPGDSVGTIRQP